MSGLTNSNKSYIIKNLSAKNALLNRLADWNSHADEWLSADRYDAFAALYTEFQQLQLRSPLCFYDELEGWECGLYQVLDIRQSEVCEMFPLLLTAYMYNYVRKKIPFVQRFLKAELPCTWKSSDFLSPNPYFIGKCIDADKNSMQIAETGIGKLLTALGGATELELRGYANSFSFPKVRRVQFTREVTNETSFVTSEYIIPEKGQSLFYRNVHKENWCTDSGKKIKSKRYDGEQFEFSPNDLLTLGYRWMYITSKLMSEGNRLYSASFACEPDLYECYRLLLSIVDPEKQPATGYDSMDTHEREAAIKKNLIELFPSKRK